MKNSKNKIMKIGMIVVSLGIVFYIVLLILMVTGHNRYKYQDPAQIDYIIVLGAQVIDNEPSPRLQARLDLAVSEAQQSDAQIIVSGGQGIDESQSEAAVMKTYLTQQGIDSDRIIMEDQSTSTYENLLYSKQIIDEQNNGETVLIVTQNFHIYRAVMLAKRVGLNPYASGTSDEQTVKQILREPFAITHSWLFDR